MTHSRAKYTTVVSKLALRSKSDQETTRSSLKLVHHLFIDVTFRLVRVVVDGHSFVKCLTKLLPKLIYDSRTKRELVIVDM